MCRCIHILFWINLVLRHEQQSFSNTYNKLWINKHDAVIYFSFFLFYITFFKFVRGGRLFAADSSGPPRCCLPCFEKAAGHPRQLFGSTALECWKCRYAVKFLYVYYQYAEVSDFGRHIGIKITECDNLTDVHLDFHADEPMIDPRLAPLGFFKSKFW